MKLKSTLFAGVLAASLAVPAFANDTPVATPLPQFTTADTQMLFEQDARPMQLVALSQQEMKETEGAFIPFLIAAGIGAGFGLITYSAPVAYNSWSTSNWTYNSFTNNFSNAWDTKQAVFSAGVGAVTGGGANIALRATGTIINYPATTFLKSYHTPVQKFLNNQIRTYTTAPGLAIKGTATLSSYGANRWFSNTRR